ncbi:MAG: LON peptidase substrate-binding domain-containing protein [Capsulimonadales bacterium]|nr:LON peptidase substrate-binding domain-containing protein [Capsulimonadales bacterium]
MASTSEPDFPADDGSPKGASRVTEIPLFPLELVLFPYMILPLHIFEERYKEMVNRCVEEDIPFGIVLVTGVDAATGGVETGSIGCTARIQRVEPLKDGRMNIEVEGKDRFRILDTHEQRSYRTALIEPFEDVAGDDQEMRPLVEEVQRLLKDFLMRSLAAMGQEIGDFDLPDDPRHLSYIAAGVLPVGNEDKMTLLTVRETAQRLTVVREFLLQEVTRLRRAAETREQNETVWKRLESDVYDAYVCPN